MGKRKDYGWCVDFETLADNYEYTYIWAWSACHIETLDVKYGNTMESFIDFIITNKVGVAYFHNLGFDSSFIMSYLFNHDYKYDIEETNNKGTFSIIRSDSNKMYQLKVNWNVDNKKGLSTEFKDSFKKIPSKISMIAKSWGLELSKLNIDYNQHRDYGQELTQDEIEYITNDVKIPAIAMQTLIADGFTSLTIGADALKYYKTTVNKNTLDIYMPSISQEEDDYIRHTYKGGFTYVNPKYQEKKIDKGIVLDVNSLYPSVMYHDKLPYGAPIKFNGEYTPKKFYDLYIFHGYINFSIKKNHIPTIQLKKSPIFGETEYIKSSNGEMVELWLTSIDLKLMYEQYDIHEIEWIDGMMFMSQVGMFNKYIEHFMEIKKKEKGAKRQEAKLFLNNLYGKLASNYKVHSRIAELNENGILEFPLQEPTTKETVYLPIGTFITAYARYKTIHSAQQVYDRFVYADTDSLHLLGWDLPNLEIHSKDLGKWKIEGYFQHAIFIRAKTYIEEYRVKPPKIKCVKFHSKYKDSTSMKYKISYIQTYLDVKCAGMNDEIKKNVTWDNFHRGSEFFGKLIPKQVKGGVILKTTTFKIK